MAEQPEETQAPNLEDAVDEVIAELDNATEAVEDAAETIQLAVPADEVTQLKAQLADAEKRVLLAQADLENYRKRSRRDTQDQLRYASLPLMNDLLEAVDNLNRAVDSHDSEAGSEGLLEGVKMVAQQISTILENKGCKKIESVGQPFDPNLHQAVQMQPSDEYDSNVVMQELRSGFQLHDRVIRPSQVFVSTGPNKE